ncbi:helix-turn-helix domain-containing protein [Paenibacillus cellulositrophicus]
MKIKEEAVRLYLEEGLGYRTVAERLGLRSKTQVEVWVKRHQEERSFADKRSHPPNLNSIL